MPSQQRFVHFLLSVTVMLSMALSLVGTDRVSASTQNPDNLKRVTNPRTGKLTFLSSDSLQPASAQALGVKPYSASIELLPSRSSSQFDPAMSLIEHFGAEFGIQNPAQELKAMRTDHPGGNRVVTHYQQTYKGIPVLAGELVVNTNTQGDLFSIGGEVSPKLSLSITPSISAQAAQNAALEAVGQAYQLSASDLKASEPALWIFDESLLRSDSTRTPELVWRMNGTRANDAGPINELVLVNAVTGQVSLHFNQIDTVLPQEQPAESPSDAPAAPTPQPTHTSLAPTPTPRPATTATPGSSSDNNATPFSGTNSTRYVSHTGSDSSNACAASSSPCLTIQKAVKSSNPGDTIDVASGTYTFAGSGNPNPNVVIINQSLTLSGGWDAAFGTQSGASTIDGQTTNNGLLITAGTVTIDRFIIQNSVSTDSGGIYLSGATLTIKRSTLQNNHAGGRGAGIFLINNASLTMINSTLAGNTAGSSGGGIYVSSPTTGTLAVRFSTIAHNMVTSGNGGGVRLPTTGDTINNTIIAQNTAATGPDCYGTINTSDHNIMGNKNGCTATAGTGDQFNVNPKIDISLSHTPPVYVLLSGSPAIDRGNNTGCPTTDELGTLRPIDGDNNGTAICDIGAYESPQTGVPSSITVSSGNNQQTLINQAFNAPLVVLVKDAFGNPVPAGISVTFTAPVSGASGTFANSSGTETDTTDSSGTASSIFTANGILGSYSVAAAVSGLSSNANFSLQNQPIPGIPVSLSVYGGNNQSTPVNQAFGNPLAVLVKDAYGTPVNNASVIFTAPSSGASGTFASNNPIAETNATNSSGIATSSTFTANSNIGGPYVVSAAVSGIASPANFSLRNRPVPGAPATITNNGVDTQWAPINTPFAHPFSALVEDANGDPVADGTQVTFTAPASGASGTFASNGAITEMVTTLSGIATSSIFTANGIAGGTFYTVSASVSGVSSTADFTLANLFPPGVPASIFVYGGSYQQAIINRPFGNHLVVSVSDGNGKLVPSRISVTFTAPASGASGTFASNGNAAETVLTDSTGKATSSIFTANAIIGGPYIVSASVSGVSSTASFSLQNTPPASTTLYVAATGSDAGNYCLMMTAPCATIDRAVQNASPGNTIEVAGGTYIGSGFVVVYIPMSKNLNISGGWDSSFLTQSGFSTIDGQYARLGLDVDVNSTVTIDHFRIQNGYTTETSGGINASGGLTLNNSLVVNNQPDGIAADGVDALTLNNTSIENNGGAGIGVSTNPLTINNSTISGNRGGGIYFSAYNSGGAGQVAKITNSTITRNTSMTGGGIYIQPAYTFPSRTLTITDTILAGNTAPSGPDCYGSINTSGHNIIGNTSGCSVTAGLGDKFNVNPQITTYPIGILQYYALLSSSPALDAGANCLTTDERGLPRPQGNACDIGAYEYVVPGAASSIGADALSNQHVSPNYTYPNPLIAYVVDSQGSPVSGVSVNFSAPSSGPSGVFTDTHSPSTNAVTDGNGVAVSALFTANSQVGTYLVNATASGFADSASFSLNQSAWFVSPSGDDSNACNDPGFPCLTMNGVLSKAFSGDIILVATGNYSGNGSGPVVMISKNITLLGGWNAAFTAQDGYSTIDGQNTNQGIYVNATGFATIDRFAIVNGYSSWMGGGIYNFGSLLVTDSSIHDNSASGGDTYGGGIYSQHTLTVNNSSIYDNSAGDGGGIYATGIIAVNDTTISNNTGAGIYFSDYTNAQLIINNATISNNKAGGVYVYSAGSATSNAYLKNSVLANNTSMAIYPVGGPQDCYGPINSNGNNIIQTLTSSCSISGLGSTDHTNVDPKLGAFLPMQGYQPLTASSLAVNAGNSASCFGTTDQRGMPRVGICDIGAYEYTVPGTVASVFLLGGNGQYAETTRAFPQPMTIVALDNSGNPVPGLNVTFTAPDPSNGPSGTFADTHTNRSTISTDPGGVATAPTFTANNQIGNYIVSAAATGFGSIISFNLQNLAWYVSPNGSDSNTCADPSLPCATINAAINKATPGDTIYIASGTYKSGASMVVAITKDIILSGGWNSSFTLQQDMTTVDGEGARGGVGIGAYNVTVDHFLIENSKPGLSMTGDTANVSVNNSQISNNSASSSQGGGINTYYGYLTVNNSTISNNTAVFGAGIYTFAGSITINNSTVSENTAGDYGGGIYLDTNYYGAKTNTLMILNSTIVHNSASSGGGIFQPKFQTRPITIKNSILAENNAAQGADISSDVWTSQNSIVGSDPQIAPYLIGMPGYYALLPGSPAIDKGNPATCLGTDERHLQRPQPAGGICDIGAYEYTSSIGSAFSIGYAAGTNQRAVPGKPFAQPLVVYVMDGNGSPVAGVSVVFSAPSDNTGPSGIFSNTSSNTTTVTTDANGIAASPVFTANTQVGNYDVVATVSGLSGSVNFALTNIIWFVAPTGSDSNACNNLSAPCLTINGAINKSSSGDLVLVAAGTYTSNKIPICSFVVSIPNDRILSGGWDAGFTAQNGLSTIDGQNVLGGISVSGNTTLDHFMIRNGYSTCNGGGISISNRSLLTLNNSWVINNQAVKGGGIFAQGDLILNDSTIENNLANNDDGGGIFAYNHVTINKSTILNNMALTGGGIALGYDTSSVIMSNSTVSGNFATSQGGGIYISTNGTSQITNSTIANNTASVGGGLYLDDLGATPTIIIRDSILATNTAYTVAVSPGPDCSGIVSISDHNIIGNLANSCVIDTSIAGVYNVNPRITSSLIGSPGYYALLNGSPAIDAGNPDTCLPIDERGMSRPQGAVCDIGAYEYMAPGSAASFGIENGSNQNTAPNLIFPNHLTVYVLDNQGNPVSGVTITFTAPASGPSGTFADNGTNSTTAVTDESGMAISAALITNSQEGSYDVTATASGLSSSVNFSLTTKITWFVAPTGLNSNTCNIPGAPCQTINGAIAKAASGDVIAIAGGTYVNNTTPVVAISKEIILSGGWDGTFTTQNSTTTIDGQNAHQGITINSGVAAVIDHLTIQNGYSTQGAGILNTGKLILNKSTLSQNTATNNGGGIYSNGSQLTIRNSTINNNTAQNGGGIFSYIGKVEMSNSTIVRNIAENGGAVYVYSGPVQINNSTISQNTATTVDNTTAFGGGIFAANLATINISNSILAGNNAQSGYDCGGTIPSTGHNLVGNNEGCTFHAASGDLVGTHANPIHPQLGNLQDNGGGILTQALLTGSPAIDAGDNSTCELTDQRGMTRPQNGTCDIGAYEGVDAGQVSSPVIRTFNANNLQVVPGAFVCDQNSASCSNTDAQYVETYTTDMQQFYLNEVGRNGIDGSNMPFISTVHYGSGYKNAFWSGAQMVYGDGYGFAKAPDLVGHELTHGVTQYGSNLLDYYQSGAINESIADIWGESFKNKNKLGVANPNWEAGLDITGLGAIRSMSNPPQFGDPDRMLSTLYYLGVNDAGGVHHNSGINNKAAFLMIVGGTFNNKTVAALGIDKTLAIYYESQMYLLTSGSDYLDLYNDLVQGCLDIVGTHGITSADCQQVRKATDAVQMNLSPNPGYNPDASYCPAGSSPDDIYYDGFERGGSNWAFTDTNRWGLVTGFASSGIYSLFANPNPGIRNNILDSSAAMISSVNLPVGPLAYLHFMHSFGFASGASGNYDGGVLEYASPGVNHGAWTDAGPLFSAGQNYGGTIYTYSNPANNNPLHGRSAFVANSHGYVSTRYNLGVLAGKAVKFRFRLGTDVNSYGDFGWVIDDVHIYTCAQPVVTAFTATNPSTSLDIPITTFTASDALGLNGYMITASSAAPLVNNPNWLAAAPSSYHVASNGTYTLYPWVKDGSGNVSAVYASPVSVTVNTTTPALVIPANSAIVPTLRPTFTWLAFPGAVQYQIEVSKNVSLASPLVNDTLPALSYTPTVNLPVGAKLYWSVRTVNSSGAAGAWTTPYSFTIGLNPPTLVAPANKATGTSRKPTFKWNAATGAGTYTLQVSTSSTFTSLLINSKVAGTTYTPTITLPGSKVLYWRVMAAGAPGSSTWSNVFSFTTAP